MKYKGKARTGHLDPCDAPTQRSGIKVDKSTQQTYLNTHRLLSYDVIKKPWSLASFLPVTDQRFIMAVHASTFIVLHTAPTLDSGAL